MRKKPSKVISARVPIEVHDSFVEMCNQKGISKSKYLSEIVSTPTHDLLRHGGEVDSNSIELPEDVKVLFAATGGYFLGKLVYKSVLTGLDGKYSKERIELYAMLSAVAVGLGSSFGIHKIMEK